MNRNIEAKIICDSINPAGKRITSFLVTYPRFIHAEIMTHRALSRNAASSRAIPTEKILKAVKENPAMPEWWGANQSGMQAKEELPLECRIPAMHAIKGLGRISSEIVRELNELGLHKQIANRYLEPWFHITVLITATEWQNFFGLRAHPDAQPEFQVLAYRMLDAYLKNKPTKLEWGDWHLPFASRDEFSNLQDAIFHSVACAARTSYTTHEGEYTPEKQAALVQKLASAGHWSPFEHQAQAASLVFKNSSNFKGGWLQYRTTFPNQNRANVDLTEIMKTKPNWIKL